MIGYREIHKAYSQHLLDEAAKKAQGVTVTIVSHAARPPAKPRICISCGRSEVHCAQQPCGN